MTNSQLIQQINKELVIELHEKISLEELQAALAIHINHLIQHHFEQLVNLLYRIDVNEAKIKQLLQKHPDENAGNLIAVLIIERQLEKLKTRLQFCNPESSINEEEKW